MNLKNEALQNKTQYGSQEDNYRMKTGLDDNDWIPTKCSPQDKAQYGCIMFLFKKIKEWINQGCDRLLKKKNWTVSTRHKSLRARKLASTWPTYKHNLYLHCNFPLVRALNEKNVNLYWNFAKGTTAIALGARGYFEACIYLLKGF